MKYIKRIVVILLIALISICAVFYSYYGIKNGAVVFADDNSQLLTNDELDIAISSWLQSHGGNLFSPSNYLARKTYEAGLIHNFVYGESDGYDGIRQHIKGGIGGNNELRFDLDGYILQKLNTWLNEKLQQGEFGQGVSLNENGMFDNGTDNNLYSGALFTDLDGYSCLIFYPKTGSSITGNWYTKEKMGLGTPYKYNTESLYNHIDGKSDFTLTFNFNSSNRNVNVSYGGVTRQYAIDNDLTIYGIANSNGNLSGGTIQRFTRSSESSNFEINRNGYIGIASNSSGQLYLVSYCHELSNDKHYCAIRHNITSNNLNNITNVDINFYTNNILQTDFNITNYPDINADGHLYITPKVKVGLDYQPYTVNQGDTITNVINNYYNDSNTKDNTISVPSDNPNGGGNNPIGGTPPNWSNPYPNLSPDGDGGFNFNFSLPDLNIDWNINGLTEKFPFSIPFDFIAFCRVLNAEPQTPEWSGTLTLPMVNYPFTFSLQQFDNVASLLRNMEFIGFCIALILATRALIKG